VSKGRGRPDGRDPKPPPWQQMVRVVPLPLTEAERDAIAAAPGGDSVLAEMSAWEMWRNDRYVATVVRRPDNSVEELSVRRDDRRAIHDWRDLQRIKSEIAGPEVEAVELYPAESRLMDTANQFYLWCLPPGERFPFGFDGRNVRDADDPLNNFGSQQRPLPRDWKEGLS
jgi:hypothetical protein